MKKLVSCIPILLLAACTTVNTVERAEPVNPRQMIDDKRVTTDVGLGRRVKVLGVNDSTGPGGLLKVQVEVENTTRSLQHFNYKFEWFDENGNVLNTATSAYVPRQIEGKETVFLTATAPTPAAKDFRLKLLENTR